MPQGKQYDDEMRGALFVNSDKQPGDKRPDRKGYVQIKGVRYELAGWLRKSSKDGSPFMSLQVQESQALGDVARRARQTAEATQTASATALGADALDALLDISDEDEALRQFRRARSARAATSEEVPF